MPAIIIQRGKARSDKHLPLYDEKITPEISNSIILTNLWN